MPMAIAFRRLRQEDYEFEVCLGCIVSHCLPEQNQVKAVEHRSADHFLLILCGSGGSLPL